MKNNIKQKLSQEEVIQQLTKASEMVVGDAPKDKTYNWNIEMTDMNTVIQRYHDKDLVLPFFQRSYVWDSRKREELLSSIKTQCPFGVIIIGKFQGVEYIIDGLQRVTSSMLLMADEKVSEEDKKLIGIYKVAIMKINNIETITELKSLFLTYNSGIPVDKITKEVSSLSDDLIEKINNVANINDFFKNANTSPVFIKNQQHKTIAMNVLAAVSGITLTDNKSRSLGVALESNKEEVLKHVEEAKQIISRLAEIYENIDAKVTKRSMTSNFLGILCRVMADYPDCSNDQIMQLIKLIFANTKAIEKYSATTIQGGTDAAKCKERYELLVEILNSFNPSSFK